MTGQCQKLMSARHVPESTRSTIRGTVWRANMRISCLLLDEFRAAGVEVVFLNHALGQSPEAMACDLVTQAIRSIEPGSLLLR